jgi:hypothetical protein
MNTWKSIWSIASEELLRLLRPQEDSWHEFSNSTAPAESVEQDFALGELPHLTEIEMAINAWTIDGHWPELSNGARHCIRMRLNAAATFVYLLFDSREPTQYLSPPADQSEREIVRWLLTAWWDRHGRSYFAQEISVIHDRTDEEPEL